MKVTLSRIEEQSLEIVKELEKLLAPTETGSFFHFALMASRTMAYWMLGEIKKNFQADSKSVDFYEDVKSLFETD